MIHSRPLHNCRACIHTKIGVVYVIQINLSYPLEKNDELQVSISFLFLEKWMSH
jgi:hypothetical protein